MQKKNVMFLMSPAGNKNVRPPDGIDVDRGQGEGSKCCEIDTP